MNVVDASGWCRVLVVALLLGCAGSLREPPRTDDPGIASLISLRLSSDQRMCRFNLAVTVHNRTARLEGKVGNSVDRRHAQQIARDAGALEVDDQLTIDPTAGERGVC